MREQARERSKPVFLMVCIASALALSCSRKELAPNQVPVKDSAGKKLEAKASGSGKPTIVLEADLGQGASSWSKAISSVSDLSQAISYDRAGIGQNASRAGDAARSARQAAFELRAMLVRKKIKPPYVIVGHGYGALVARIYTSAFASEVSGLVLIEPTHEAFDGALAGILSPEELAKVKSRDEARVKELGGGARREAEALPKSLDEVQAGGFFPDVPLVVLAGKALDRERFRDLPDDKRDKVNELRIELMKSMAEIVADGRFREAKGAGADIPSNQPEAVAEAIKEVVRTSRAR